MSTPVLYKQNLPCVGTACLICGHTDRLINDHCHTHGWVRGALCMPCNQTMRYADVGLITRTYQARAGAPEALQAHRARCGECDVIALSPLTVPIPRPPATPDPAKVLALLNPPPPADPLPRPAERLRLRSAGGFTQQQVADALEVTRGAVSAWEAGRYNPRGEVRAQYAEFLRILAERHPQPERGEQ